MKLTTRATLPLVMFWCAMGSVCSAQEEILSPDWTVSDVGSGTKPSFDFDANGRFHVMAMTERIDGEVWYAVADSAVGPWNPQTIAQGYFYGPGDLRVGPDGTAHIAWHDHDAQDAASVSIGPNGNRRSDSIPTEGRHDGWDNSLAFDSTGTLHQANVDPLGFGATTSLSYAGFSESGWTTEVVPESGSFMYGFNTSLAFDPQDNPHILFTAAEDWTTPGDLKHAFRADGKWQIETVATDGIRGRFPNLAYDSQGRAHAVWLDIDEEETRQANVQHGVLENGLWTIDTVDRLDHVELAFTGGRKQVSIAIDSDDTPHIAFGDRRFLNHATLEPDGWQIETVLEADDDLYNGLVVMRIDPTSDRPAIVFWQRGESDMGLVRLLTDTSPHAADFNLDGRVDALDIDLLAAAVRMPPADAKFDIDGSGQVDDADMSYLIEIELDTYFGDSNLDGEFNSGDLVELFTAGQYEDGIDLNSSWATGDWDGNRDFDSGDFVLAFERGGYELGPRLAVNPVPEPGGQILLMLALTAAFILWRPNHRIQCNRVVSHPAQRN